MAFMMMMVMVIVKVTGKVMVMMMVKMTMMTRQPLPLLILIYGSQLPQQGQTFSSSSWRKYVLMMMMIIIIVITIIVSIFNLEKIVTENGHLSHPSRRIFFTFCSIQVDKYHNYVCWQIMVVHWMLQMAIPTILNHLPKHFSHNPNGIGLGWVTNVWFPNKTMYCKTTESCGRFTYLFQMIFTPRPSISFILHIKVPGVIEI